MEVPAGWVADSQAGKPEQIPQMLPGVLKAERGGERDEAERRRAGESAEGLANDGAGELDRSAGSDLDPQRDARLSAELAPLLSQWQREQAKQARSGEPDSRLEQFRWLLEELRVALFAEVLGTAVPVSENRVRAALGRLRRPG